jgi:hypothetical protein
MGIHVGSSPLGWIYLDVIEIGYKEQEHPAAHQQQGDQKPKKVKTFYG